MLDDSNCNFHEITALDSPIAFFDVLSPPYSDMNDSDPSARHCHFYRKLMVENSPDKKILKLERIDCPSHYYCDSIYFERPDFMR
jgi:cysteamine dioxygenase